MEQPKQKRKHRATGKAAPGGKRKGAGRPQGVKNTLGYGEVNAVKAAGLRVSEGAPVEHRDLADESLEAITKVMRGQVFFKQAPHVLKAATHLRTELLGPLTQKVEHSFADLTDEQLEARYRAITDAGSKS